MPSGEFEWLNFLDLAQMLSQSQDDEAALRSAISRAYYAAYHHWLGYAQTRRTNAFKHKKDDPASHQSLISWFKQRPDEKDVIIGDALDEIKRTRVLADYNAAARVHPAFVLRTIENVQTCIRLPSGENR